MPDSEAIEFDANVDPSRSTGNPGEPYRILFLCTGNTCRSPLAEALARSEVRRRGWGQVELRSAGVSAAEGAPASEGSLGAARRIGLDLRGHRSTPLTLEVVRWADLILTMSPAHLRVVQSMGGGERAALLTEFAAGAEGGVESRGMTGVADPFGGGPERYDATALQLRGLVADAMERLTAVIRP